MYEPSLLPLCLSAQSSPINKSKARINLSQDNHEFSDIEKGVKVVDIEADFNRIVLSNGRVVGYRELVYSGYPQDWISKSKGKDMGEYMVNEDDVEGISSWPSRIKDNDHIVFTVPKSAHYGYSNYHISVLQSLINSKTEDAIDKKSSITMVCEGDGLFPFSPELSAMI